MVIAVVSATPGLALTKRTLSGSLPLGGSITMKVEINMGEVKRIKGIKITGLDYYCAPTSTKVSGFLKGPSRPRTSTAIQTSARRESRSAATPSGSG